mmetsp:Transcript_85560/g.228891  ORF Transcript_85560/g.228891 Transcript_85560/m.228891 type:complete len:269 (-) Transcript_85560:54-860(-)
MQNHGGLLSSHEVGQVPPPSGDGHRQQVVVDPRCPDGPGDGHQPVRVLKLPQPRAELGKGCPQQGCRLMSRVGSSQHPRRLIGAQVLRQEAPHPLLEPLSQLLAVTRPGGQRTYHFQEISVVHCVWVQLLQDVVYSRVKLPPGARQEGPGLLRGPALLHQLRAQRQQHPQLRLRSQPRGQQKRCHPRGVHGVPLAGDYAGSHGGPVLGCLYARYLEERSVSLLGHPAHPGLNLGEDGGPILLPAPQHLDGPGHVGPAASGAELGLGRS